MLCSTRCLNHEKILVLRQLRANHMKCQRYYCHPVQVVIKHHSKFQNWNCNDKWILEYDTATHHVQNIVSCSELLYLYARSRDDDHVHQEPHLIHLGF